ncbi:hypothetical protein V1477_011984 [Vespula maculifrons]|uniref:Uncharacterized protein n=3 Tax=Vespula TaxID=7451 RepID=A0A834MWX6_VESGE|nr:hypothetical protein HZH66_011068 [Vespula vulgaris]KAF7388305.1 hypothetical protein HZH68_012247 [Vespula germanica]
MSPFGNISVESAVHHLARLIADSLRRTTQRNPETRRSLHSVFGALERVEHSHGPRGLPEDATSVRREEGRSEDKTEGESIGENLIKLLPSGATTRADSRPL